jgi:hypothetical protein
MLMDLDLFLTQKSKRQEDCIVCVGVLRQFMRAAFQKTSGKISVLSRLSE